ncbi:MAG: MBL fold metallo-hydrolase [Gemmatimonadales bacterium]
MGALVTGWLAAGCPAVSSDRLPLATLLDSAIATHGGSTELGARGPVEFRLDGDRVMIDQSRRADPPWDPEPSHVWIVADPARGRWMYQTSNSYPGLGPFAGRRVIGTPRSFEIDPVGSGHGSEIMPLEAGDSTATRESLARYVPGLYLEVVRSRLGTARELASASGRRSVEFTGPAGQPVRVHLVERPWRLSSVASTRPDELYGEVTDSAEFVGSHDVAGLLVPERLIEYANGAVSRELTYRVRTAVVADSLFTVPTDYHWPEAGHGAHHMPPADTAPLVRVARGVFVHQATGTMIVEFSDHLVAFDCPNDSTTSAATIAAATARLGQKPFRYLIASHTHPDHCGGARGYYARGATLIAAAGHGAFFRRLARTGAASIEPLAPGARRVLEDGHQRVVIYNVGPSPHSVETVIGYLPEQRLLWQVDLFLVPMTGSGAPRRPVTDWLAGEITRLGLDVGWIIDTHTGMVYPRSRFNAALGGDDRARRSP